MAAQSLKDKTVKGVAWSGIDNVVQFGVTFIVSIVLARLLSPDDYGLIGIITIFTDADVLPLDIEDSVPVVDKQQARDNIKEFVTRPEVQGKLIFP